MSLIQGFEPIQSANNILTGLFKYSNIKYLLI